MNRLRRYPFSIVADWFERKSWKPFPFQLETWEAFTAGKSGLLNAPTGSGKTYALWLAVLLDYFRSAEVKKAPANPQGLQVIWLTPLRALSNDIYLALQTACEELEVQWEIGVRTGDTPNAERQKQLKSFPQALITTPESLHILLSHKKASQYFRSVKAIIVDEWHELLSTKRGIQVELALSRIKSIVPNGLKIWGISATIGNLPEALDVLLGNDYRGQKVIIKANIQKRIKVTSLIPDHVEKYPWAGHLGIKLLPKVLPIIRNSTTTLLFTNTRSQTEIWYREILLSAPDLAGAIAMHHGSLDNNTRLWVENALQQGRLKLVVCTSSLDLGVDFKPVQTIIQVGGPKGVSRFMQRAGRSGHQPGALSKIYFVPAHSLELVEGSALRTAIKKDIHENRVPLKNPLDVLIQYLMTLSVGEGLEPKTIYQELLTTHAYRHIQPEEWQWALSFITTGGKSLQSYQEFSKAIFSDGRYQVPDKKTSMRHRLSIGTIVGDPVLNVKYHTGGHLGTIEESFISMLNPGDTFWFGGRCLELVRVRDLTAYVSKAKNKRGRIPVWGGGRLPLSSKLAELIRMKLEEARQGIFEDVEMKALRSLLVLQSDISEIPGRNTLLIEYINSGEGYHMYVYPFEGRFVHEVLGALVAYRISRIERISFSIAMNDYGFELYSDKPIPIEEALELDLFTLDNIMEDLEASINKSEMAKRKFRDIATISGLVFQGYPGKNISTKHLQSSSNILYQVFEEYDPENLLIKQAKEEVVTLQLDYTRLIDALRSIQKQEISLVRPIKFTPFSFPIMADRLREKLTSEKLSDRILKLQHQLEGLD